MGTTYCLVSWTWPSRQAPGPATHGQPPPAEQVHMRRRWTATAAIAQRQHPRPSTSGQMPVHPRTAAGQGALRRHRVRRTLWRLSAMRNDEAGRRSRREWTLRRAVCSLV